jgi:hypothetical protein
MAAILSAKRKRAKPGKKKKASKRLTPVLEWFVVEDGSDFGMGYDNYDDIIHEAEERAEEKQEGEE